MNAPPLLLPPPALTAARCRMLQHGTTARAGSMSRPPGAQLEKCARASIGLSPLCSRTRSFSRGRKRDLPMEAVQPRRPSLCCRADLDAEPAQERARTDQHGPKAVLICQHGERRVARVEKDGAQTALAIARGQALQHPNDSPCAGMANQSRPPRPAGLIKSPLNELAWNGVYRLARRKGVARVKIPLSQRDAFFPDEKPLLASAIDATPHGL